MSDQPIAYPYLRESHAYSAATGISWQTQLEICQRYWEVHLKGKGVVLADPVYDKAVSARKVPFLARDEGYKLNERLKRGDHVIVAYHDRQHRSVSDFCTLIEEWQPRGITMHFANLGVDLSTPHGMAIANMMFAMAQWQSDAMSERNKAVASWLKSKGRPGPGRRPMGYYVRGPKGDKQYVPYPEEREMMRLVVFAHDRGITWDDISEVMEQFAREKRRGGSNAKIYAEGLWTYEHCRQAYRNYKQILKREGMDVTEELQ